MNKHKFIVFLKDSQTLEILADVHHIDSTLNTVAFENCYGNNMSDIYWDKVAVFNLANIAGYMAVDTPKESKE